LLLSAKKYLGFKIPLESNNASFVSSGLLIIVKLLKRTQNRNFSPNSKRAYLPQHKAMHSKMEYKVLFYFSKPKSLIAYLQLQLQSTMMTTKFSETSLR